MRLNSLNVCTAPLACDSCMAGDVGERQNIWPMEK
jgi:hypothetical protein